MVLNNNSIIYCSASERRAMINFEGRELLAMKQYGQRLMTKVSKGAGREKG